MARVRKSSREKLQEKLMDVQEAIEKYEECLQRMKEEKKEYERELKALELEELIGLMNERNMSVEDVKRVIEETGQAMSA
ncbi:hypothetical protein [Clostridium sp. AM58-1XD]|uniref:hypothetical protein n=1 Tax=Clostridium sp. AM58-1XD TaxID=2292307 RepID=UPI0011C0F079|nr:hypothetical protein [Clostridium sp. AM58-1XD]